MRAWLRRLCDQWSGKNASRQERPRIKDRRRLSLRVEKLEDRITPSGLLILPLSVATDTAGASYSTTLQTTGGDGHYTYTLASGMLPSGISLNSSTGLLSGKTTVSGIYSFSVKVTDTTRPSLTGTQTEVLTVTPGALASFALSAPGTVTAGTAFGVTVTAKDAFGNTVTTFKGSDTLTCSDGQKILGTQTVSLANGVGTASITLDTADGVTLTASSGAIKGTSSNITINPGALATFRVSNPSSATAGSSFQVTVTAKDAEGNTITAFSGPLTWTSSDGQKVNLAAAPTFTRGTATAAVTLNSADTLTLTASSGAVHGSGSSITVKSVITDWFSQNLPDAGLQALARSDFTRDNTLTYSDMLGLFAEVEGHGAVTAAELQSLQALISPSGVTALHLTPDLQSLTSKVVAGDPANATYQGQSLGNLKVGSTLTQLQELVNKWFLGADHPAIDTQYIGSASYTLTSGTLFGSGGPSYQDVAQGEEGDCWLLASLGVTAANDPSVIKSMFTYDGTNLENGVAVQVWTVRFYDNGAATYLTVDNYLPASNGYLDFADLGHAASSSNNVLWVPLAEKAYAQLCADGWNQRPQANAYSALNGGSASTALPVITGHAESTTNPGASASSFINALASGTLITLGSVGNVPSLGIVGSHDYAVLGYNASNQTFTLLNPWGWNSSYSYDGYKAAGTLHLTWSQLCQYFYLDGNCNPLHAGPPSADQPLLSGNALAGTNTASASSPSGAGLGSSPVNAFGYSLDMSAWQQWGAMMQASGDAASLLLALQSAGTHASTASII